MTEAIVLRASCKEILGDALGCCVDAMLVEQNRHLRPGDMRPFLMRSSAEAYVKEWLAGPEWKAKLAAEKLPEEDR
jgi:hypothetical protein